MSEAYQFAVGRSRALILVGCFVVAAVLLFLAGAITGTLYSSRQPAPQASVKAPVLKAPDVPAIKAPEAEDGSSAPSTSEAVSDAEAPGSGPAPNPAAPGTESTAGKSAGAVATASEAAAFATPKDTAAASPGPASALSTSPSAAPSALAPANPPATAPAAKPALSPAPPASIATPSYATELAVRVGSFSVKSNAETVTQSLRDKGYQPTLSRSTDAHGRVWYVVKLGPYTKWNTASLIATRVSIAENVTPVIGPMQ